MIVQYLSEEQENKLIEMSLSLFTKYKSIDFVGTCDLCLEGTMRFSQHYNPTANWNDWILIHWFEFCMTHLSTKIFNGLHDFSNHMTYDFEEECSNKWDAELMQRYTFFIANPARNIDKYPDGKIVAWHPVDYLYEQFKNLKQ